MDSSLPSEQELINDHPLENKMFRKYQQLIPTHDPEHGNMQESVENKLKQLNGVLES